MLLLHQRIQPVLTCFLSVCRPGVLKDLKTMGSVSLFIFFITLLVLARQVSIVFLGRTFYQQNCVSVSLHQESCNQQTLKHSDLPPSQPDSRTLLQRAHTVDPNVCCLLQRWLGLSGSLPPSPLWPPPSPHVRAKLSWHRSGCAYFIFFGVPSVSSDPRADVQDGKTPPWGCARKTTAPPGRRSVQMRPRVVVILGHQKGGRRLFWKHNFVTVTG